MIGTLPQTRMRSSAVIRCRPWRRAVATMSWSAGSLWKSGPSRTLSAAMRAVNGSTTTRGWLSISSSHPLSGSPISMRLCAASIAISQSVIALIATGWPRFSKSRLTATHRELAEIEIWKL